MANAAPQPKFRITIAFLAGGIVAAAYFLHEWMLR
jgi:hypothetical protein